MTIFPFPRRVQSLGRAKPAAADGVGDGERESEGYGDSTAGSAQAAEACAWRGEQTGCQRQLAAQGRDAQREGVAGVRQP